MKVAGEITGELLAESASAVCAMLRFAGLVCPAWVYVFPGPRSYTGETIVEYHLPGSPVLAGLLLTALADAGCRPAEPGEFTARAYFHGRLDLAQAEGVAAVISAQSDRELAAARRLLGGELTRRLAPVTDQLVRALALVEVGIDFSDEDVTFISARDLRDELNAVQHLLTDLLDQSARFEPLTHEPTFVLSGLPNAGKSTLLNALAGQERAVTSPAAGTTRDALSARVRLRRGWVRVVDVAGIESVGAISDAVEQVEVAHARERSASAETLAQVHSAMRQVAEHAIDHADAVLKVRAVDATSPNLATHSKRSVVGPVSVDVVTKVDLLAPARFRDMGEATVAVSALTGAGITNLKETMDAVAFGASDARGERLALNRRHVNALQAAVDAILRAARLTDGAEPLPIELVAAELREATNAVGVVQGQMSSDDLLGEIFSRFCIGK